MRVSPKEITVNTSDAVLLNCQYIANPASLTSVKWYKSGELVDVSASHRYEGGNPENVALAIKETENGDSGNYTCELENTIGKGVSETEIELDVLCKYKYWFFYLCIGIARYSEEYFGSNST